MKRRLPIAILGCLLLGPVAAAGDGYVGASLGQSSIDVSGQAASFQLDDIGWKAYGGYKLFRWFGLEGSYMDTGNLDETQNDVRVEANARVFSVSALGILPFTPRAELFAKVGAASWSAESSVTETGDPVKRETSGTDFTWGVGLAWNFAERWGLRLELEYFTFENEDSRFGSLGIRYTF
jgi:OOP family OmpA-OmpF porin